MDRWVPMPSYLLRKQVILSLLCNINPAKFIEVGSGMGDVLITMGQMGWRGFGVEISSIAAEKCKQNLVKNNCIDKIKIINDDFKNINCECDLIMAFEVLEHLKEDVVALKKMHSLLRENGKILLSVPAKMSKWSKNDIMAGHFRRYERLELIEKLKYAGFTIQKIQSYGFPLANIVQKFRSLLASYTPQWNLGKQEKTELSGVKYPLPVFLVPVTIMLAKILLNNMLMWSWYNLQRLFFSTDLGIGYIIAAKKN